ncbi:MAG: methylmalonyl-CoA mutase family protein, partial [Pseudomonadota bacterium]
MNDIDLVSPRDLPAFADWQALALKALKGAELASLTTHLPGGLTVEPLYIAPDEAAEPAVPGDAPYVRGTRPFVTEREADEAGGAAAIQSRRWDIRQRHAQAEPAAAHGALLDDLTGGVTSILLQMAAPGQPGLTPRMDAMATALGGEIALNMIGVHLDAGEDYLGAAQSLMEIWRQAGLDAATARGGFGADPLGAMWRTGSVEGGLDEALATLATFTSNNAGHYPQVSFLSCNGAI